MDGLEAERGAQPFGEVVGVVLRQWEDLAADQAAVAGLLQQAADGRPVPTESALALWPPATS